MTGLNQGLLEHIAKRTQEPLDAQIAFFDQTVNTNPTKMISGIRALAEATVEYLYFYTAKTNSIPGPYWCLIFKSNEFRFFSDEFDKNKKKGRAYPEDYQKMWEANQLLKTAIPDTFIFEANSVKKLGNMVLHNNPQLANMDLPREARKCLDSYKYLLSEVNRVVSAGHTGNNAGSRAGNTTVNGGSNINIDSGNEDHFPKTSVSEGKGDFSNSDVKKWFAGVQAELARERAKTQEDYDMEDDENY